MALDTSMLTLDAHQQIAAGRSIEQVAKDFHTSTDAVRQYIRKINPDGTTRYPAAVEAVKD